MLRRALKPMHKLGVLGSSILLATLNPQYTERKALSAAYREISWVFFDRLHEVH